MDRYIAVEVGQVITGDVTFYAVVDTEPTSGNKRVIARGGIGTMAALRDALNGA